MDSQGTTVAADEPMWVTEPDFLDSDDLERLTGTTASTWRYWAHIGSGPPSFRLGRRRVWRKTGVLAWLEAQETASA